MVRGPPVRVLDVQSNWKYSYHHHRSIVPLHKNSDGNRKRAHVSLTYNDRIHINSLNHMRSVGKYDLIDSLLFFLLLKNAKNAKKENEDWFYHE